MWETAEIRSRRGMQETRREQENQEVWQEKTGFVNDEQESNRAGRQHKDCEKIRGQRSTEEAVGRQKTEDEGQTPGDTWRMGESRRGLGDTRNTEDCGRKYLSNTPVA